ncbi:synaptophysin-like [Corticium candelabrum]|uniref:synaptophysin-like n=1 Tax=Corticium candelabrum TaxID=121492 RepID=UPI002E263606|nr:synaptophysin-like [Corticium candelabrum]
METNFSIFKYPRGFIKILELLFAILAFALLAGYNEKGSLTVHTTNDLEVSYSFKVRYSFGSGDYQLFNTSPIATGRNVTAGDVSGSYQSDAQFLVAMGVISFLYILAMCLCYPLWECRLNPYRRKIFYSVDFAITGVVAFLWIIAGGVWARGSDGVIDNINKIYNAACSGSTSCNTEKPNYSGIVAAVCFGFLNFFLWAGNVWFTFKETPFFKWKKPTLEGVDDPSTLKDEAEPTPESTHI